MRIYGYDKIKQIDPTKTRSETYFKQISKTISFFTKSNRFTKGYQEAITWSFTDSRHQ